jgi:sugar/nucleoside kinase (ribokinase family)
MLIGGNAMDAVGLGTLAMDVLMKVDVLPKEDSFCVVEETTYAPGGSGTNVIVQLARLGAHCGYIGKISDDKVGKNLIASLRKENIDTDCMVIEPGKITVHTDIVIDRQGNKFIMLNMGDVFHTLTDSEIDLSYIQNAKVFYTDLLPQNPAVAGLKAAKKAGVSTVFNMQVGLSTMNGFGITKQEILDSLSYVDIFAPCREGLYEITGTTDLHRAKDYLRSYFKGILLFTLGADGSVGFDQNDNMFHAPIWDVVAVDTTGAGDSYIGGFIYSYILKKEEFEKAMNFASACAAYTCSGIGARFSPTLEQVNKFMTLRRT